MEKSKKFYLLMAIASIGIIALPVGIANFIFGYLWGDAPCHSCWAQREMMMLIGLGALFVVRYGLKLKFIAMILLFTATGMLMSFYHFGAHALEDIGQGFGLMVLGLHTQFWAEVVFWAVIILLALIFAISSPSVEDLAEDMKTKQVREVNGIERVAFIVFFVVAGSNSFQAIVSSGPPPYESLGDPLRFTLTQNEWRPHGTYKFFSNQSFYGKRIASKPDLVIRPDGSFKFSNDFENSPLKITKALSINGKAEITPKFNAPIRNLKFESGKNRYLVSTEKYGFYITDDKLKNIEKHFILDRVYSATVDEFVGVSVLKDRYRGMGSNKTFHDFIDDKKGGTEYMRFAQYMEGGKEFRRVGYGRDRLKTTRAKFQYAGGSDNDEKYTYIVTTPNDKSKDFIIMKQLNEDQGLSAEFKPKVGGSTAIKDKRSLGELYPTGLLYKSGKLLVLSKNYNTIAVVDLKSENVEEAYSFPKEIKNARSITQKDGNLQIVSYENGKNILYTLN